MHAYIYEIYKMTKTEILKKLKRQRKFIRKFIKENAATDIILTPNFTCLAYVEAIIDSITLHAAEVSSAQMKLCNKAINLVKYYRHI